MSSYEYASLRIDPYFEQLIPPLSSTEFKQLEANLIVDGCREPLCVWGDIILDGHNRFKICKKHHLLFHTVQVNVASREEAIAWICSNQLGRRNLSEGARHYLIGKRYEVEKLVGERKIQAMKNHVKEDSDSDVKKPDPEIWDQPLPRSRSGNISRTSDRLSREYHISHSTIEKYGRFASAVDVLGSHAPELVPKILSGHVKISYDNAVALSQLTDTDIKQADIAFSTEKSHSLSDTRKYLERLSLQVAERDSTQTDLQIRSIKEMPAYDPDERVNSLAFTIPSWIQTIENIRQGTDWNEISSGSANTLLMKLDLLLNAINQIHLCLEDITVCPK